VLSPTQSSVLVAQSFGVSIAVGTVIADRPPHRSVRAELPHTVLTADVDAQFRNSQFEIRNLVTADNYHSLLTSFTLSFLF
jgi:hypothetical protein